MTKTKYYFYSGYKQDNRISGIVKSDDGLFHLTEGMGFVMLFQRISKKQYDKFNAEGFTDGG